MISVTGLGAIAAGLAIGCLATVACAEDLPTKNCSAAFLTRWRADSDAALKSMPKEPCWMRTSSGPYVCYKDGCVRASAYFDGG
jgi:hypothetical protein